MVQQIKFKNRYWELAGNLFYPENFDAQKTYPAIVCVHPGSSVKEQTSGLYAEKLATEGFITLAFDASFQGESGGEPRHLEEPAIRVEDIRCAVDYFTTLKFVNDERIGVFGICAGAGYAVNAAMSDRRIKAVGVVSPINMGRARREHDPIKLLEAVGRQRTAEANGAEPKISPWTPTSLEEAHQAGITDMDALNAIEYYRTPRANHPRSDNKLVFISSGSVVIFDAFNLAEQLLTQPLSILVGDKVGSFGAYRDGFELLRKAASSNKKIHVVNGASHYDFYDMPFATGQALEHLAPFYREIL